MKNWNLFSKNWVFRERVHIWIQCLRQNVHTGVQFSKMYDMFAYNAFRYFRSVRAVCALEWIWTKWNEVIGWGTRPKRRPHWPLSLRSSRLRPEADEASSLSSALHIIFSSPKSKLACFLSSGQNVLDFRHDIFGQISRSNWLSIVCPTCTRALVAPSCSRSQCSSCHRMDCDHDLSTCTDLSSVGHLRFLQVSLLGNCANMA